MTRLALTEPLSAGGNWWSVIEVPWSRQEGPPHPELHIPTHTKMPFRVDYGYEPLELRQIVVRFHRLTMAWGKTSRALWTATFDGDDFSTLRLLNIAYTCPETHVDWAEAVEARENVERILKGFGA